MALPEMTHWERIRATLKGEETDRVPISLWRHWPPDDETPEGLAAVTLNWQTTYDFDLVKVDRFRRHLELNIIVLYSPAPFESRNLRKQIHS